MQLTFDVQLAAAYTSPSQRIRVLSEAWIHRNMFCPNCGQASITKHDNNTPAGDFYCSNCSEQFELKSTSGRFGGRVVDGAYATMFRKAEDGSGPNLFLLAYHKRDLCVTNLDIIPRQFISPKCIQQRKPLSINARRAGWVGCNILLSEIPQAGVVEVIRAGTPRLVADVERDWSRVLFLRNRADPIRLGWLLETMKCIDALGQTTFKLADLYAKEADFRSLFPANKHPRAKLRQQLQMLRDAGYLQFSGRGVYRLTIAAEVEVCRPAPMLSN